MTRLLVAVCIAFLAIPAAAEDFEIEFTEQALNRMVESLGNPGMGGLHQPNHLGALGYNGCSGTGTLSCSFGGSQGATGTNMPLTFCLGPDGRPVVVPSIEPVPWQWWITAARFTVDTQRLNFTANVRYRVGIQWFSVERTVPAALVFDLAGQKLRMETSSFTVPIRYTGSGVNELLTEVDVARHISFSIPTSAQTIRVPDLNGDFRTVRTRTDGATVQLLPGKILVKVDGSIF